MKRLGKKYFTERIPNHTIEIFDKYFLLTGILQSDNLPEPQIIKPA
jgi:hypothetical protein